MKEGASAGGKAFQSRFSDALPQHPLLRHGALRIGGPGAAGAVLQVVEVCLVVEGLLLQAVPDIGELGVAGAGAALVAVALQAHEAPEEVEEPQEVHEDTAHLRGLQGPCHL